MAESKKKIDNVSEKKKEVKKSKRSIKSIPSMPFEDAIVLAQAIWDCASGRRVRKITLFDHIGKSPDSGPSRSLITSSSKYGLTTGGYQAEFLELTETGAVASNPDSSPKDATMAKFTLAIENNQYFKQHKRILLG